jgi:nucleotide-binding universal stress UspA family protein
MFKKILVALENNQISLQVFDEALLLAKATNANLMLIHVMSPFDQHYINPVSVDPYSYYPTLHSEAIAQTLNQWDALKEEGIKFLSMLCKQGTQLGIETEFTQNFGEPGRIICEIAQNWQADLIIVGRRGRIGLSEFFLGSVSNYVLHHAPCSVLTVQGIIPQAAATPQAEQVALHPTS